MLFQPTAFSLCFWRSWGPSTGRGTRWREDVPVIGATVFLIGCLGSSPHSSAADMMLPNTPFLAWNFPMDLPSTGVTLTLARPECQWGWGQRSFLPPHSTAGLQPQFSRGAGNSSQSHGSPRRILPKMVLFHLLPSTLELTHGSTHTKFQLDSELPFYPIPSTSSIFLSLECPWLDLGKGTW